MYGWLHSAQKPGDPPIAFCVESWDIVDSKLVTGDARSRRATDILLFVNQWAKDKSAEFRNSLLQDLKQLADWVPQERWPFAMDMWLAHAHLEPEMKNARKAAIDDFIAAEFTQVAPSKKEQLERIRHGAPLIPDALMESELRLFCSELRVQMQSEETEIVSSLDHARYHLLAGISKKCREPDGTPTPLGVALTSIGHTRSLRDLNLGLVAIVDRLASEGWEGPIAAANAILRSPRYLGLSSIFIDDALLEMLTAALGLHKQTHWPDFVEPYIAKAEARHMSLHGRVFRATLQALKEEVPMGASGPKNQALLRKWMGQSTVIRQVMDDKSVLGLPHGGHATPTRTSPDGSVDIDPVWSWAVDRLAQWIEGPVAETAHNAIDRHKIVEHETKAAQAQAVSHDQKPAKPMTVDDVGEVIQKGLRATAQFFADELHDLLPLAAHLGVAQTLVDKSKDMCKLLLALATENKSVDEVHARNLLVDAEIHIQSLRDDLKSAEASAAVQSRFPFEFDKALRNESIALGKRHGGVIDCHVRAQDWSYVAANFHRRWLPHLQSIEIDGSTSLLSSDQALGLYVTASSQSAYAFDVSVHLWRRRPGKSGPASLEDGALPPMNTGDWFDTYVPCCVLHVPALKK